MPAPGRVEQKESDRDLGRQTSADNFDNENEQQCQTSVKEFYMGEQFIAVGTQTDGISEGSDFHEEVVVDRTMDINLNKN